MNKYIGHESQICGVEEHRLVGGKGDGMRLLQVQNGKGLQFTISLDRCADISRLNYRGINMGYFSPCGYVAPAYYDDREDGFLKSFTAGFLTTCGLFAAGAPCTDQGERLPLHGSIGNTPAEHAVWDVEDDKIVISAAVPSEVLFSHKLVLYRKITCSLLCNEITVEDKIVNRGDHVSPLMLLYHMNIGYPLLSEHAKMYIPSCKVIARNERAQEDINTWDQVLKPQPNFVEQCYYHEFDKKGIAGVFNPDLDLGLMITFDAENLPFFTQWKMMGERDYVMGLEPGNCNPDGRDKMRSSGRLTELQPEESVSYHFKISMIDHEFD